MSRLLLLVCLAAGCVQPLSEIGLPCPCGGDFVCCVEFDLCLPPGEVCTSSCGDGLITHTETCDPESDNGARLTNASCQECGVSCDAGFLDCEGGILDGCETDPLTSLAHCGGCGRACLADEICRGGLCAAIIAQEDTGILGVAADDAGIYWIDPGIPGGGGVPPSGIDVRGWSPAQGVLTLAAEIPPVADGPVVISDHVVWAAINGAGTISRLARVPKNGSGGPEIWFDSLKPLVLLAAHPPEVAFLASDRAISTATTPPDFTFEVMTTQAPLDLRFDLGFIYWRTATAVMRTTRGSLTADTYLDAVVSDFALVGDNIYVVDGATLEVRAAADGSSSRSVATTMQRLATNADGVFGVDGSSLLFLGPADTEAQVLFSGLATPRLVTASDTYVAWVEGDAPAVLWKLRVEVLNP